MKTSEQMEMPGFPLPSWAWFNLYARETLSKKWLAFLLLDYYLEFYIQLQRESSNKGDW